MLTLLNRKYEEKKEDVKKLKVLEDERVKVIEEYRRELINLKAQNSARLDSNGALSSMRRDLDDLEMETDRYKRYDVVLGDY